MLHTCPQRGCRKTAFFRGSLHCSRCNKVIESSSPELVQMLPQGAEPERLVPNNQPDFIGIDLAAPGKSDYSAPVPPEYLGGGGDFGGGGASSSYSSDSGSSHSSSDSSSSSSDSSSGSSSSSDW